MRLFVALEIPDALRENLAALLLELGLLAPQARWTRAEKMHVTLKFIGEVAAPQAAAIQAALTRMPAPGTFPLSIRGLRFFPNEKHPRVLWAGIEAGPQLPRLAAAVESVLAPLGVVREERAFTPHLTLARFNQPKRAGALAAAVEKNSAREFATLDAQAFHLFESQLQPSGAEYTRLASFPLKAAEA